MKITRDEVAHVAKLARLDMAEKEMDEFTGTLNAILEYADKLNRVDIKDTLPTAHVLPLKNVFRQDKIGKCLPRAAALANAPQEEKGMFRVPRIIE